MCRCVCRCVYVGAGVRVCVVCVCVSVRCMCIYAGLCPYVFNLISSPQKRHLEPPQDQYFHMGHAGCDLPGGGGSTQPLCIVQPCVRTLWIVLACMYSHTRHPTFFGTNHTLGTRRPKETTRLPCRLWNNSTVEIKFDTLCSISPAAL